MTSPNSPLGHEPAETKAAPEDKLSRHLTAEHHAIQAQSIDSPMNACSFKETCLWLKRLAAPQDQQTAALANEAKSAPAGAAPLSDLRGRLEAAGRDERLATGALYLEAAAALEQSERRVEELERKGL